MSEPSPPAPSADDLFAALVMRYLDGAITPEGLASLNTDLKANSERRSLFVTLCALHGNLSETMKAVPVCGEPGLPGDRRPLDETLEAGGSDSILEQSDKTPPEPGSSTTIHNRAESETVRIVARKASEGAVDSGLPKTDDTIRNHVPPKDPTVAPNQEPGKTTS